MNLEERTNKLLSLYEDIKNGRVDTRMAFVNALMCRRQMDALLREMSGLAASLAEAMSFLGDAAAKYAESHSTALDAPGLVDGVDGSRSGSVKLDDGTTYRLTIGVDKVRRADGGKLVKAFLDSLPESWLKTKRELSMTAICDFVTKAERKRVRDNPNCKPKQLKDYLREYGLVRGLAYKWQYLHDEPGKEGGE